MFCVNTEKGVDWKNDSSGNEGAAGNTDPEAQNSDPSQQQLINTGTTNSPPREKEAVTERRSKLFRATSSTPNNKKKQSLSLSADQQANALKSGTLWNLCVHTRH